MTKKIILSLLLAFSLGAVATTSFAAGKIKNATTAEVEAAMESTVKGAEATLEALNNGADKEALLQLLSDTKQTHKRIEVTRLGRLKGLAATQMRKARSAVKKDDLDKAKEHLTKGVDYYHQLRKEYYAF